MNGTAEVRLARPDETAQVIDFINMVFSVDHEPHNFKKLLPKAYADDACTPPEHYIAVNNGRIEGCVGLLPVDMTVMGEKLRCGIVGSVSVHPYARGSGYMKACMNAMLKAAAEQELQLLYLGGKRQRYEYFGFSQGGVGMTFDLIEGNFAHGFAGACPDGITFAPIDPYIPESSALYDSQTVHAQRKVHHFGMIAKSWISEARAVLRDGTFIGYMIVNGRHITELALLDEADAFHVLPAWYKACGEKAVSLSVPVWNRQRVRTFSKEAQRASVHTLDMFRLQDIETNLRLWLRLKASYARLPDGETVLELNGERLRISVKGNRVRVEKTTDEPEGVFDRLEAQDLLLAGSRWVDTDGLPACVEAWFPLPVSVFSADGY